MGVYAPPCDSEARDRVTVFSTRPLAPLGRIVAVREKQKAMGFSPVYDAQHDLVDITHHIHGNLYDALKSEGEDRKLAFAKIGALALSALEREEELERIQEAARIARELTGDIPQ